MLAAVLDVRELAWSVTMIIPRRLTLLGDVLSSVYLTTTLQDISKLLVLDTAIIVRVNEVVDVQQLLRIDGNFFALQSSHELFQRDRAITIRIGKTQSAYDAASSAGKCVLYTHEPPVESRNLLDDLLLLDFITDQFVSFLFVFAHLFFSILALRFFGGGLLSRRLDLALRGSICLAECSKLFLFLFLRTRLFRLRTIFDELSLLLLALLLLFLKQGRLLLFL